MSLRRKLVYLLLAFAVFALVASFGTIHGIQWRVSGAIASFQRSLDESHQIDQLRLEAREQLVQLSEIVARRQEPADSAHARREAFFARIEQAARFARPPDVPGAWQGVRELARSLREELVRCEGLAAASPGSDAAERSRAMIEQELMPQLDRRLCDVRRLHDEARLGLMNDISSTNTEVLLLALAIGAGGVGLLVVGAALIRRWLILPLSALRSATVEFGRGNLGYQVTLPQMDEVGQLGAALNQMASSLAEAQSRLRRADAMEATLTLARGVAHDFNNLLTSATGTLSLLGSELTDARQAERVSRSLRACWQAAALARKLLDFARGDRGHPQLLHLRETVDLILDSLDESFFDGLRLHQDLDPAVRVSIDRDQLTQIVLNLLYNARDAMPAGGDLRITVSSESTREPADLASATAPYGVLSVADTGCGMTPEVQKRMFEPFFTTKRTTARRGRGMGLSIVYAAVQNAGGFIEVDSRVSVGTTFRVHLPIGDVAASAAGPRHRPAEPRAAGAILVVDDDPMILWMATQAFEKWGYAVTIAESALEARLRFAHPPDDGFVLAVIDMELPDGAGIDLARSLVAAQPDLRLIFTTGFSDQTIPDELAARVCTRLIKPFRLEVLAAAVASVLAPPGAYVPVLAGRQRDSEGLRD